MREVSLLTVRAHLDVYARAGVDTAACFDDLPWTEDELRGRRGRIDWDDYATLLSRMSEALGDDEAVARVGEAMDETGTWINALVGSFVSPTQLFRFWARLVPTAWHGLEMTVEELGNDRIRVRNHIPRTLRPCRALFVASRGAWVTTTTRIGLPRASLVSYDVSGRHGEYVLDLPPSATLVARVTRAVDLGGLLGLLEDDRASLAESQQELEAARHALAARRDPRLEDRLAAVGTAWRPTPGQLRVLAHLVVGMNNKEIAAKTGITEATVEAHVTRLLRKSGTENRTALAVAFWNIELPAVDGSVDRQRRPHVVAARR
jgi:DNA-binding CsgD family transcriptional regulator